MTEQTVEISASPDDTLISLADLKTRLGISDSSQDTLLDEQGAVVTAILRDYTGRLLTQTTVTATIRDRCQPYAWLPNAPIISLTSVTLDSATIADAEINKTSGRLWSPSRSLAGESLVVVYVCGWATIPTPLSDVYARLVKTRIDGEGAAAGAGSGVKSKTIFGSHKIDYYDAADSLAGGRAGEMAQYSEVLRPYVAAGEMAG